MKLLELYKELRISHQPHRLRLLFMCFWGFHGEDRFSELGEEPIRYLCPYCGEIWTMNKEKTNG